MRKTRLGADGPEITRIGLGTWALGGSEWRYAWGPQDDADSIAAIRRALDLGISWIDTAAVYGHGHSEEAVGRAIEGRRDEVVVAT
jgi:aryl-alcohol dehydrogenase-like predicted oxidoreductase